MPKPRIADIQCSRLQFKPGDRILVKVYGKYSKEELEKLRRSVERWAGSVVEVLIYDAAKMEISIEHGNRACGGLVS